MGCFSTPKYGERTSGVPRYSSRVVSRDSNFSLLANKPVELPDPRTLLEGTKKNSGVIKHVDEEPVASIVDHSKSREQLNYRAGKRTSFSGPLLYNNVAMADSSRASTNYFSSDDVKKQGTGMRLRRASSFGGRPQPLPLPIDEETIRRSEVKHMHLPLPAPQDVTSQAPSRRATSSFKLEAVDDDLAAGSRISRRGRMAPVGGLPLPPPSVASKLMPSLPAFEFRDLMLETDDFSAASCVERGAFGTVFSARLKDPSSENNNLDARIDATVLRLPENSEQGCLEWRSEVQLLAQISSPNVCAVKGYCTHEAGPRLSTGKRRQERLLVFEQPYNGPLSDHLFGNRYMTYLDWRTRIDIALGVARGLLYIHDHTPLQIVYKYFCASNVLLNRDFAAKLAGYGLSVTATPSSSFKPSMQLSQAHAKNNVWSYGIFLLELLTGKNSRDETYFGDDDNFLQWGRQYCHDEAALLQILDPRMKELCPIAGAMEVVDLLLQCASRKEFRPSMAEVVGTLEAIKAKYCSSSSTPGPGASRRKNKGPASWALSPPRVDQLSRDFQSSSDLQSSTDASSSSENEDMFTSRISPQALRAVV